MRKKYTKIIDEVVPDSQICFYEKKAAKRPLRRHTISKWLKKLAENKFDSWSDEKVKEYWKSMGSSQSKCAEKVRGNVNVEDPEAFCAALKDRATGTTKWRGKESMRYKCAGYDVSDKLALSLRAELGSAVANEFDRILQSGEFNLVDDETLGKIYDFLGSYVALGDSGEQLFRDMESEMVDRGFWGMDKK